MQKYTNFIIIWKLYDFFIFASDTLFSDFILSDGCMFSYLTCIQLEPEDQSVNQTVSVRLRMKFAILGSTLASIIKVLTKKISSSTMS